MEAQLSYAVHTLNVRMPTISIRVPDAELAEIDERATAAGCTRTAYMLRAALGAATADERRLEEIEERLGRVEEGLFVR